MSIPKFSRKFGSTILLFLVCSLWCLNLGFAQQPQLVTESVSSKLNDPPALGRDLWFSMCQNYDAGGGNGKYYMLYVTPTKSATIHIQVTGSSAKTYSVKVGEIVAFAIPLSWEVTTSGVLENKGIHVWSADADLSAYLLSRNPYTSDGMFIIPSIGWANDYVVAAYSSLFESTFDYPSEFLVVANHDSTSVQVTPSWDIRATGQPTTVLHPRNKPFIEKMSQGTCVQYEVTQATNPNDYDVTGSLVNSDRPVGVVGASQCSNIPSDFPYCDHICDMIPPIRCWGKNYYTAPFARRYGGDSFKVIASTDSQKIYRSDASSGEHLVAILNKYQFLGDDATSEASRWYSDKPFLLVQYINSTTFPGTGPSNNGIGDPSMVVIPCVEQFTTRMTIQTPTILGGQSSFTNFFNVIVPKTSANTTFVDGKRVNSGVATLLVIDTSYQIWRFPYVAQGVHTIVSDTLVGSYVYGYGSYDSYAWAGSLGSTSLFTADTTAPRVTSSGSCFCSTVSVTDSGAHQTGLSSIILDSVSNMYFYPDPQFTPGTGASASGYSLCVIDSSLPAYLAASAYDLSGHHTSIVSTYVPHIASVSPRITSFGSVPQGTKHFLFDTLINLGSSTINIVTLHLLNGGSGFSLDSADKSPLKPGEKRLILISFTPKSAFTSRDTLLVGTSCQAGLESILVGNGGNHDFLVSDLDFGCIYVSDSSTQTKSVITNLSAGKIKIDSIWVDDPKHFHYVGTLPFEVAANSQSITPIPWKFTPDSVNPRYATAAHFRDTTGLVRSDSLFGCSLSRLGVEDFNRSTLPTNPTIEDWLAKKDDRAILLLPVRPNPATGGGDITFTLGLRERAAITLKLYDLLGKEQAVIFEDLSRPEGIFDVHFNTQHLATGTYIYRLEANGEARSGRLVIGR